MANAREFSKRKSYLSLTPVDFSDFSLTTNSPAQPNTPPAESSSRSPSPLVSARPPTAGGGPLSSHPTSAEDIHSSFFPPTPDTETDTNQLAKMSTSTSSNHDTDRADSFRTPASPSSTGQKPSKGEQQKQSVRKLFSLNNLRNSFSSSRTSLQNQNSSAETSPRQPRVDPSSRPSSRQTITPQMRPRAKSGSWFRRKSGMFLMKEEGFGMDAVVEDKPAVQGKSAVQERPASRDSIEQTKEDHSPAPLLPEIGNLGNGGTTSGGDLGWDEGMFKR